MATPKHHIQNIRKDKFSIGGEANPLTEDLHQAVKNLSAELYAKDVHFLMELIQNAEDNEYPESVDPSLEYIVTSRDITGTGAPATLLVFNNEKGFSSKNIDSVCSVGRSTKKGNRKRGYIGEKGIGFKSVFLVTSTPYIFSNGYQIKFSDRPCPHCNLGYIVPEWVEETPSISDIQQIYGSASPLPTTTIILPLKPDKVKPVKQQLSCVHPEVLLFLQKMKRFVVREDNLDPNLTTVTAASVTSETNFVTQKNIDAQSYTIHLSAEEKGNKLERECSYYMWRQKFPVKAENKVERRMEVEEWVITLAFPNGERLHRGTSSPGIYAFLPTEMVTNFPFIIQADFVLASSRETILLDDKWNQGILDCVPSAFVNAFKTLVKGTEDAPVSSLPRMFEFLPVAQSSFPKLNLVRQAIRSELVKEAIVPSGTYMGQKFFHKPCEISRLSPSFWSILVKAENEGVNCKISSHGRYILDFSFDRTEYDDILKFLGVEHVSNEWYAKCIEGSNIVLGVSERVYMDLLVFVVSYWESYFSQTSLKNIPLIKYVGVDGAVSLCSITESSQRNSRRVLCMSNEIHYASWLLDWNKEFRCTANHFFLPKTTQEAIRSCSKREAVLKWLNDQATVVTLNVNGYADVLRKHLNGDKKFVIAYAHFLYHSFLTEYLPAYNVKVLCKAMPLVDDYGHVTTSRDGVLVPADGSKWALLIVSNPWKHEGYVELGEEYMRTGKYAGETATGHKLMQFLRTYADASDIPRLNPPNAVVPAVSGPLTKENTFLLLDWIRYLKNSRSSIPQRFMSSIKEGSWLRTTMNGSSVYRPPSQSFFYNSSWGTILENGSMLVDIPLVDISFYGDKINLYEGELRTIGVMFDYGEACKFIARRIMSLASSSSLTRSHVLAMLKFIKYLTEKFLSPEDFISSVKAASWLKTCHGYRCPRGSLLFTEDWITAPQISDIPFIDRDYYGKEILCFQKELELLGVVVEFNAQDVVDYLKSPSHLTCLTADAVFLILECIRKLGSGKLTNSLAGVKCLKTKSGYKSPAECYLHNPEWGCILEVFSGFALIDDDFYGKGITLFKDELKMMGCVVDFDKAIKSFAASFRCHASTYPPLATNTVLSLLSCYMQLEKTAFKFPQDLKDSLRSAKWLKTRLGDVRSPRDCILYGEEWNSIAPITLLPFIDDGENCYGKDIHKFKKLLKSLGTTMELKDGVKFVMDSLCFPSDPSRITSANVLSLLKCVGFMQVHNASLLDAFLKKLSKKWIKTHAGYMSPDKCLLFDSKWSSFLHRKDGPFIDEDFYGTGIQSYRKELALVGVTVDVDKGCALLFTYLERHTELAAIVRIYNYLIHHAWKPHNEAASRIWIPTGRNDGQWVDTGECVLHDSDALFASELHVLEKYYERNHMFFFSSAFNVRSNPSLDDYCKLWKIWETTDQKLSHTECSAFWRCVMRHKSKTTEETLAESLMKLPVCSNSDSISLSNKHDVFIADDLLLKEIFQLSSPKSIFVWYPQPSMMSLPRAKLFEVYRNIGVRTISESVEREEVSLADTLLTKRLNPNDVLIGKGIVTLILGFLADPSLNMEAEKRHEAVGCLLNLTVLETLEPITVNYSLMLSSGETINAKASRMIRWDRGSSKFFTQKMERSGSRKNLLEYATHFSEVIANGILWEKEDYIGQLSELLKIAFLLEFNKEAVEFLMKLKNLQVYQEDVEFLSTAFPYVVDKV